MDVISLLPGLTDPVPDLFEVMRLRIIENFEADAEMSKKMLHAVKEVEHFKPLTNLLLSFSVSVH